MTKKDHKTATLILKVARKIFIKKGFAATSISEIAKECNINKSLIYHHFENKESLWKAIKGEMISTYIDLEKKESDFSASNLMELLEKMVTLRFDFYTENPDIIRLILFQKLEANSKKLEGVPDNKYNDISVQVKQLQDNGEIRKDIDADFASYLIFTNAV
ncbi:MAG: TetR/AcrR family transcriptional regulator, partial [Rickettsiaceae bacterium]|nr:TetR/AcrR family transcriptional regulator [Rickettsiaceae bacterium]